MKTMSRREQLKWEQDQLESLRVIQISLLKLRLTPNQSNNFEPNENDLRKSLLSFRVLTQAKIDYFKAVMKKMHSTLMPKLLQLSRDLDAKISQSNPHLPINQNLIQMKLSTDQILFELYDFNFKHCVEFREFDVDKLEAVSRIESHVDLTTSIINSPICGLDTNFTIAHDQPQAAVKPSRTVHLVKKPLKEIKLNTINGSSPKRIFELEKFDDSNDVSQIFKRFRISNWILLPEFFIHKFLIN